MSNDAERAQQAAQAGDSLIEVFLTGMGVDRTFTPDEHGNYTCSCGAVLLGVEQFAAHRTHPDLRFLPGHYGAEATT